MSAHAEKVLFQHLTVQESVEQIAKEGMPGEVIPTEALRPIYAWVIDYFFDGGREKAPSLAALQAEFGDLLNDYEIDMTVEPEDTVQWAMEDLRGTYIHMEGQKFLRDMATALSAASTSEKPEVIADAVSILMEMTHLLENRSLHIDARQGMAARLQEYERRTVTPGDVTGMRLGLHLVDNYTYGIQPGELAVLAAGPKTGKSWMLCVAALEDWLAGRNVVLYSLENSVEMTLDRIACIARGIPYHLWQHGQLEPEKVADVQKWIEEIGDYPNGLWVVQPEMGKRTPEHIVRDAQLRGADSLMIDQLSHIEISREDERRPKHEQIGNVTTRLRNLITGRERIPCLLAHQISREGVKMADKTGYLEMYHLAESAVIERTADFVFGMYASRDDRMSYRAKFQILAARREDVKAWEIETHFDFGGVNVLHEVQLTS